MKGKSTLSSTSPIDIPNEDDIDEVITKVVDSIYKETAAEIESQDVRPNVATSGTSENPISPTPIAVVVDEPIVEEPESEDEESADQDSEEETEEEKSDPSKDDEVLNQTIVQEPAASQPNDSDSEESTDEDENVQIPTSENVVSGDNSDDIPITKSVPESVAAKLKTKNEGPAKKDMESASTPVSYKSRQVSLTPMKKSDKKKKTVEKKKCVEKKKSATKRKRVEVSSSDPDVRPDVTDIGPSSRRRKLSGKKVPANIPAAPLDNISFHFESSAQRWRYVYRRRIAKER
jgi:hypothetical protein